MFTKTDLAKKIVSVIVCAGTSKIVTSIIKNNTPMETVTDKITVTAGSFVLGAIVADASRQYTDKIIDGAIAWYKEHISA